MAANSKGPIFLLNLSSFTENSEFKGTRKCWCSKTEFFRSENKGIYSSFPDLELRQHGVHSVVKIIEVWEPWQCIKINRETIQCNSLFSCQLMHKHKMFTSQGIQTGFLLTVTIQIQSFSHTKNIGFPG